MNKKILTLLPIFSMFAVTGCKESSPTPDIEQFEKMEEDAFKNDVNTSFNLESIIMKYENAFVIQEGTETFRGMIKDAVEDINITGTYYFECYNDATHFANYHLLNLINISNIRTAVGSFSPRTGDWIYQKGNKGSRLITYNVVNEEGICDNYSFLYNSDFVPVKIIERATIKSSIDIDVSFTYIF